MKKNLLILTLGLSFSAFAQNGKHINSSKALKKPAKTIAFEVPVMAGPVASGERNGSNPSVTAATVVNMGTSANAYGASGGPRTSLWSDPVLNTVTFIHRGAASPGSGYLTYDISKDGGATWTTNVGPVFTPGSPARYPQGVIYNPTGNLIADSAWQVYFAPTLDASNSNWGGWTHGVHQLSNLFTPTQADETSDAITRRYVPDAMTITKQGVVWAIDEEIDLVGSQDYTDTLNLSKGVWNSTTRTMDFTTIPFYAPVSVDGANSKRIANSTIAFGPSGLVGYIVMLGHNDYSFNPDSSYYPIVYKTTDGGTTWTGPINVDLSNIETALSLGTNSYTTAFQVDAVVDMNDDLHMTLAIGASTNTWSIASDYGFWGMFHVYTNDGGTSWRANLLEKPHRFRGTFGALNEDSRGQMSMTYAGDKVFFTWFDTDTTVFTSATENLFPDAHIAAYDVVQDKWTASTNATTGVNNADGEVTFGQVGYYVFGTTGTYSIPVAFQKLIGADTDPVDFKYISGVDISDADFTISGTSFPLIPVTSVNDLNSSVSVSEVYPNPFSSMATFNVNLVSGSDVTVEIMNTIGQTVRSEMKKMNSGSNQVVIEKGDLEPGMYMISVYTSDSKVSKKIMVK